jgi:type IV secretion system protein VirD4
LFDPLGISGIDKATWSPLRAARDLRGALAAAQMLARGGGDEGPHDRFWRGQAEQLIAAMLWTAANTEGHSMRNVVKWVLDLDRPTGDDNGTLAPLVRLLTDHAEPAVALSARQVQGWLHGQWKTDSRTTSSVYATARNAVWPWADPDVAASAEGCDITLDWLLEGRNTLYLCAPLGDETRIGAVFAALLHDLVTQAFDRYNRVGDPLEPRLLVLLDEAANTPLPKLPQWASTVTGAGVQLVTVWQSKAQLEQIYGRDADNVLTNHRTKLVYPSGLSDMATFEYVSALVGKEHVRSDLDEQSWNRAAERPPARTPATAVPFVSASILRQMEVGDALLLHGELPPAWIRPGSRATRDGALSSVRPR